MGDFFDCVENKSVDLNTSLGIKLNMMKCARYALKTATFFELFRQSNIFDYRILQIMSDGSNPSVNKEAWRLFYQLISYHNGFTQEMVKKGFIKTVLNLFNEKTDPTVVFNGTYYIRKLIENPDRKKENSVRPKRKDIKSFISYFKKNDCFDGFHRIYLSAKKSNFNTNLFPAIAHLFKVICTSFLANSLKKNLFKNKDYNEALNSMYDFFKIKKKVDVSPSVQKKSSPPLERKN